MTFTKCQFKITPIEGGFLKVSYQAIGRNIRSARLKAGLTQEKTAELLGLSLTHYGRLERGERALSLEQLVRVSEVLQITVTELIKGMTNTPTILPLRTQRQGIGLIIGFLSAGCSDKACGLMLEICRIIAEQDKFSS